MAKFQIEMLRGKVIRGTPSRTVPKGVITIDTEDPRDKDLWPLLEMARTGAKHMGRRLCRMVVAGPNVRFSDDELSLLRLTPQSAYPEFARALAEKINTSHAAAALQVAQAMDLPVELFMPDAPAQAIADPEPAGYQFSEQELESLREASTPQDYRQAAEGFARFRGVSIEEAAAELGRAVGRPWPLDLPAESEMTEAELEAATAPESAPEAPRAKKGNK